MEEYKNYKNFMDLCPHKDDFRISAKWVLFATSYYKSPCDGIGWSVKQHVANGTASEDESYVDIHDFNFPTIFEIGVIGPSAYVTCIYNSPWLVGMINLVDIAAGDLIDIDFLVDIAAGDIIDIDFMHPHGPQNTFN